MRAINRIPDHVLRRQAHICRRKDLYLARFTVHDIQIQIVFPVVIDQALIEKEIISRRINAEQHVRSCQIFG